MQFKRLVYSKKDIDAPPGYKWILSPYKLIAWLIFSAVLLFFIYALMRPDTQEFLRESVMWAIIGLVFTAIAILIFTFVRGMKTKLKGYLIALVFIVLVYVILGWVINYTLGWDFNYGYGSWVLMLVLAGFHKIDEKLDFRDVMYAIFVVGAIIGGNIPFGEGGSSALDRLSWMIQKLFYYISMLDLDKLKVIPPSQNSSFLTNIYKYLWYIVVC